MRSWVYFAKAFNELRSKHSHFYPDLSINKILKQGHKMSYTARIKFKRQQCNSTFVAFVDLALTSVSPMFVCLVLLF